MDALSPETLTLLTVLVGGIISGITQILKKWSPIQFHPMLIVAILSIAGGIGYAFLVEQGIWVAIFQRSTVAFTGAVAIYELVKNSGVRDDN